MARLEIEKLTTDYGPVRAVDGVTLAVNEGSITTVLGANGAGKTSLLRTISGLERASDGRVRLDGEDILTTTKLLLLRQKVGMVFQRPSPFPMSIRDNVAFAPRLLGWKSTKISEIVQQSLERAALWDEVSDRLDAPATSLSGGQQQRLVIARCLAVSPDVILMDEPCSALDPVATLKIEDLMVQLAHDYTIVIVTHNMQQAARVSDFTAFMLMNTDHRYGELIEFAPTAHLFNQPQDSRTEAYITGRFG